MMRFSFLSSNFGLIVALLLLFTSGCTKDVLPTTDETENSTSNPRSGMVTYNWTTQEANFFSLNRQGSIRTNEISFRTESVPTIYHPLLVEAYNEIARQNELHSFVENMAARAGFPLWRYSFIASDPAEGENIILIPIAKENTSSLTSVISVHKTTSGRYLINGISRQEILDNQIGGSPAQRRSIAKWMLNFEEKYFGVTDQALKTAFCNLNLNGEPTAVDPSQAPLPSCQWVILDFCSDDETQTSWIGGMVPPHLDHDMDGIVNYDDQDWLEFSQLTGFDQDEYREFIDSWWEEEYQQEYGDYADYWYNRGGAQEIEWEDVVIMVEDLFGHIGDVFEEIWDDIRDAFEDAWDSFTDLFYPEPPCWGGGINDDSSIDLREVRCESFYVWFCNPTGIDNWWQFADIIYCANCDGQNDEDRAFTIKLQQYLNIYNLQDYQNILLTAGRNCPVLAFDNIVYDCFSQALLDYFQRQHPGITISPNEIEWLIDNPEVIGDLLEYSEITGQGDISPSDLDLVITVGANLSLDTQAISWLLNDIRASQGSNMNNITENLLSFINEHSSFGSDAMEDAKYILKLGQDNILETSAEISALLNLYSDFLIAPEASVDQVFSYFIFQGIDPFALEDGNLTLSSPTGGSAATNPFHFNGLEYLTPQKIWEIAGGIKSNLLATYPSMSSRINAFFPCRVLGIALEESCLNSLHNLETNANVPGLNRRPDGYFKQTIIDGTETRKVHTIVEIKGKFSSGEFNYSNQWGQLQDYLNFLRDNTYRGHETAAHGLYMILPAEISISSNIIQESTSRNVPFYHSVTMHAGDNNQELMVGRPTGLNWASLNYNGQAFKALTKWSVYKGTGLLWKLDYNMDSFISALNNAAQTFEQDFLMPNIEPTCPED